MFPCCSVSLASTSPQTLSCNMPRSGKWDQSLLQSCTHLITIHKESLECHSLCTCRMFAAHCSLEKSKCKHTFACCKVTYNVGGAAWTQALSVPGVHACCALVVSICMACVQASQVTLQCALSCDRAFNRKRNPVKYTCMHVDRRYLLMMLGVIPGKIPCWGPQELCMYSVYVHLGLLTMHWLCMPELPPGAEY